MHSSRLRLLFLAAPAVAAGFAVLYFGAVGKGLWLIQLLAVSLAFGFAALRISVPVFWIIFLTLAGEATPLLQGSPGPDRWLSMGPVNLYMAPILLPSFLVAISVFTRKRGGFRRVAFTTTASLAVLLAIQPDTSQVLALLAGSMVAFIRSRSATLETAITLICVSLATAWAFFQADPLVPVPYVERVFALVLGRSRFAGAAVIASAITLVVGLYTSSRKGPFWLAAVAAYYAVLFGCSVMGLTPAPLIGYGAGPLIGFGLMVAVSCGVEANVLPNNSFTPTRLRGAA